MTKISIAVAGREKIPDLSHKSERPRLPHFEVSNV